MIEVQITTALESDKIGAVAIGEEDLGDSHWDWFEITNDNVYAWWAALCKHWLSWGDTQPPLYGWNADGEYGSAFQVDKQGHVIRGPFNWEGPAPDAIAAPSDKPNVTLTRQPALIDHHVFHNGFTDGSKIEEEASVSLEVSQSAGSEWSKESSFGGSLTVGCKVGVEGAGEIEESATFSWDTTVGESHNVSKTLGAGTESRLKTELEPGDWALGLFGAWLGDLTASVPVSARISNWTEAGIIFLMNKHHWLTMPKASGGMQGGIHKVFITFSDLVQALTLAGYGGKYPAPVTDAAQLDVHVGWYADNRIDVVPLKDDTPESIHAALVKDLGEDPEAGFHIAPGF